MRAWARTWPGCRPSRSCGAFLDRLDGLELAGEPVWSTRMFIRGLSSLPGPLLDPSMSTAAEWKARPEGPEYAAMRQRLVDAAEAIVRDEGAGAAAPRFRR